MEQLGPRLLRSMTGGAAGTFASFGEQGQTLQVEVARILSLDPMPVPSRSIVDHFAEFVLTLGMIAATAQSVFEEIQRLDTPEYGEASEAISAQNVGSSTMPQKRVSPHLGAGVIAAASARAAAPLALEAMIQSHEVDGTRSVMMDRALEQASVYTVEALENLVGLVRGLTIDDDRMRQNLDLTGGLITSERVMLRLAATVGRQTAHHVVHDAVNVVRSGGVDFTDALLADPTVAQAFTRKQIEELTDPTAYMGLSEKLARDTAIRVRENLESERQERDEPTGCS